MGTPIKLAGDSRFSIQNVQRVSASARGETVELTVYVTDPDHESLVPIQLQLVFRAADDLLIELAPAVAQAAKHRAGK